VHFEVHRDTVERDIHVDENSAHNPARVSAMISSELSPASVRPRVCSINERPRRSRRIPRGSHGRNAP